MKIQTFPTQGRVCVLLAVLACCAGLTVSRAATVIQSPGATYVAFEAEGNPNVIAGTPETWAAVADTGASGGSALAATGTNDTGGAPHSFAQYSIRFATPGTYYLYYRWKADAARTVSDQFTANSSFIPLTFGAFSTPGVDGRVNFATAAANGSSAPANNSYAWQKEPDTIAYTVTAQDAAGGAALILTIGTREAGMFFDRLVLSTDATLAGTALDGLANSDTDVVVQGTTDTFVAFEAETKGKLIAGTPENWVVTADNAASGGGAIVASGTNDTGGAPHSFAQFSIRFTRAGSYFLYSRWKADAARTVSDQFTANSSWMPTTFGAFSTPGEAGRVNFVTSASNGSSAPANNNYGWQKEPDTLVFTVTADDVSAGRMLVLTIGTREAGMYFDRIVLSEDGTLTAGALDALPNSGSPLRPPEIASIVGSGSLTIATVSFSKALAANSVTRDRFQVSGGVTVTAAALDAADQRRVVLTTSAQTQGTLYTVTVNGVTDTSGVAVRPDTKGTFSAWKLAAGWAFREIYFGVTGQTVAEFKDSDRFRARQYDRAEWVKGFDLFRDPYTANYGARITAMFTPQAGGAYTFYVNPEDEGELSLSADATEANLVSLGVFPAVAGGDVPFSDASSAASPSLVAGRNYFLEGVLKQNSGDAYLRVGAKSAASSTPAESVPVLGGNLIASFVNPDAGKVEFVKQPLEATATVGGRVKFVVEVKSADGPVYYQWRVNGQNIPNAIRASYTTPPATEADHGKVYSVVVSVAGRDTASADAKLNVVAGDPSPFQPYIGINFVGGGDSLPGPMAPSDTAGVVWQENWNNLNGFTLDAAPLRDAAGATTPVTLSATGTETWYTGTASRNDGDGWLMQGFIGTGASLDPFAITLNGIPAGNYNVIVYSTGFPFTPAYEERFELAADRAYGPIHGLAEVGLDYNAAPGFRRITSTTPETRQKGNYVQFDNVRPDATGSMVISTTWESTAAGNGHQPAVNGIQLVKVVPVTVRPTLSAALQGANLVINWGASAAGFTLESTAVAGTGAAWSVVAGVANPLAGAGSTSVPAGSGARYYRLRK